MKNKLALLALLVFILFRIIYLDRDLPPGDKTKVGGRDEQFYNFTALNLYHFGSFSKQIDDRYKIQGSINTVLNNVFPYATLILLGNNYYGLRSGAVFASILIFLLFFLLLRLDAIPISKKNVFFIKLIASLLLIFDFGFLVASRNASPPIFRCLYLMMVLAYVMYLVKKPWGKQKIYLFLLGIICSFLIFFSYLTNVFIFAGVLLFIGLKGVRERRIKRAASAVFLILMGAGIGVFLTNFIYILFYGSGIIETISETIKVFSVRIIDFKSIDSSLNTVISICWFGIRKILSLLTSNVFAFNYSLLYFLLLSCFATFQLILKRKPVSELQLLSFSFILAYSVQAFIYNPDSSKWIALMTPVFLLTIIANMISQDQNQSIDERFNNKKCIAASKGFFFLACGLSAYRFLRVGMDIEFKILNLISMIILLAVILIVHKNKSRRKSLIISIILVLTIMPNVYLCLKYCVLFPKFHYRDACISLNKIIGDKNIAGIWSDGFRLYTKGNTFYSWYQVQNEMKHRKGLIDIFERKLAVFTVDFPDGDFFDVERDIGNAGRNFQLKKIASLYLGKGTSGKSIWVYKRVEKTILQIEGRQP